MNILLVHNAYQQLGGEDVVFDQERQMLERAGHRVLTYRRSNSEVNEWTGIRRVALMKNVIWSSATRRDFLRLLQHEKPDVVHVHNTFAMISPSIYSACAEAGMPVVQTLHNYRLFCPRADFFRQGTVCEECLHHSLLRSVRYACYQHSRPTTAVVASMLAFHRLRDTWNREISCFIALTEFCRRKFIEGGLPADRIFVKPNFVHPDPLPGEETRNYAVYLGRLAPEKLVGTVLAAWKLLPFAVPLLIVGDGPDRAELEAEAVKSALSSVRFLGRLPRDQALAAVRGAKFLVFTSGWYESFGMTIAEAFACGTPVIASRLGVMEEIVADGRTGLHFNPGDPNDLAKKVEWAWTHPDEIRGMGNAARKEFELKYTAERNYPTLMEIYEQAKRPRPGRMEGMPNSHVSSST